MSLVQAGKPLGGRAPNQPGLANRDRSATKTASHPNGMDHHQHLAREDGAIKDWNPAHLEPLVAARFGSFGGIALRSNLLPRTTVFEDGKFCLIPSGNQSTGRGRAASLGK